MISLYQQGINISTMPNLQFATDDDLVFAPGLTHCSLDKIVAILQTTYSDAFS